MRTSDRNAHALSTFTNEIEILRIGTGEMVGLFRARDQPLMAYPIHRLCLQISWVILMWPSPPLQEDGHVLIHLAPPTDASHVRTSCEDTANTVIDANSLTQSVTLEVVVRDLGLAPDLPTGGQDDMDTVVPLVIDGADQGIVMASPVD